MNWRDSIYCRPSTASISTADQWISVVNYQYSSPIDIFLSKMRELIMASTRDIVENHPCIGGLAVVGGMSSVELYFRQISGFILSVCPKAKINAKEKTMPFGSVVWHREYVPEMAILDGTALSGSGEIKKILENIIGIKIKESSEIYHPLNLFDKICEIRHNIVHSSGLVAGKNAVALSIQKPALSHSENLEVKINYALLNEIFDVYRSLVISVNKELFIELSRRWAVEWYKNQNITRQSKFEMYRSLWMKFCSRIEAESIENNHDVRYEREWIYSAIRVAKEYRASI